MVKELDKLKANGWDLDIGDLDRLLVGLSDLKDEIGGKISEGAENSSDSLSDIGEKITSALEDLPKGVDKNLQAIGKKQADLLNSLEILNKTLATLVPKDPKEPEKIGAHLVAISKQLGMVMASFNDSVKSIFEKNAKENQEILKRLEAILNKPSEIKPVSWDFDIIRDYDTDAISKVRVTPA
jgi:hypothetical protein